MTRRRWIADEFDAASGHAILSGTNAEHLIRVLRARVGQEFDVVADGASGTKTYRGRIARIGAKRVEFELGDPLAESSSAPGISLLPALFKFDRMEWAIEKAVELGVERVTPLIAARSQKHLVLAAPKRLERWKRIAREAAQQSRRASVPEISEAISVAEAIKNEKSAGIVLAEGGAATTLREALAGLKPEAMRTRLALAIGPEGGWREDELALFRRAGWQRAWLGTNILRAETAAIAAIAITAAELQSVR